MEPDAYVLSKAGLSKEQIEEITGCDDKEMQVRMLRRCRYRLLDEIHGKQQTLDEIDYIICKMREQNISDAQQASELEDREKDQAADNIFREFGRRSEEF